MAKIGVVVKGQRDCSGFCGFCHGRNHNDSMGYNVRDIGGSLSDIDRRTLESSEWDFDAMEAAILKYWGNADKWNISVWGADPLTSFGNFVELYDWAEDFASREGKDLHVSASTNGLAFYRPEVLDYIRGRKVSVQLSHDGLGQFFRTRDIDPLDIEGVREALRIGKISHIHCVLNYYNTRVLDNIDYFNGRLKGTGARVHLQTMHTGKYNDPSINTRGLIDGYEDERLKGTPMGDYMIRNSPEFPHKLDDFIHEWTVIYKDLGNPRYDRIRGWFLNRLRLTFRYKNPPCSLYHHGDSDFSNVIDTTGRFTECHLLDSTEHVPNPQWRRPEACNDCRFNKTLECNMCGMMEPFDDDYTCQFNYRWNLLMEEALSSAHIRKWLDTVRNRKA